MPEQVGMDLRSYVRSIRKNWWLVLLAVVLSTGAAGVVTLRTPPIYASSVTFFVTTPNMGTSSPLSGDQFGQQRVNSYVKLLPSERLATMVVTDSGVDLSPKQVMRMISGEADINTVILTATVQDTSPERSLSIAKSISTQMVRLVNEIETQGGKKSSPVQLDVVSGPTLTPYPVSPRKKRNIGMGIAIGLLLGFATAVVRETLDNTIKSTDVLRNVTHRPALGSIPFDRGVNKAPLITSRATSSIRGEAFRQLRTSLQFINVEHPVKVLVVTSSTANEGKSLTAANLALVFAEAGTKVLLIEADLRRPRVCDYLGLERSVGLTNVLAGQASIEDSLQSWGGQSLTVLPSGSAAPNPSELLGSQNMVGLMSVLRTQFDMVIIDTPPLLPVTDGAVVSAHSDGALLVVRHGKTRRAQLAMALRSLDAVGASVLGSVLNMTPNKGVDSQVAYDGYGYYEDNVSTDGTDRESSVFDAPRARRLGALIHRSPEADHVSD